MKVVVNLPETKEDITELNNRVANFHATLLINKIQSLYIDDKSKKKVLDNVLNELKKKCMEKD